MIGISKIVLVLILLTKAFYIEKITKILVNMKIWIMGEIDHQRIMKLRGCMWCIQVIVC